VITRSLERKGPERKRRLLLPTALLVTLSFAAADATADMVLTPQGVADGFTLATFAPGIPNFPAGNSNGTVLVTDLNGATWVSSTRRSRLALFGVCDLG
jgi:hypothetical protein